MAERRLCVGGPMHGQWHETDEPGPSIHIADPEHPERLARYDRKRRQPDGRPFFVLSGLRPGEAQEMSRGAEQLDQERTP